MGTFAKITDLFQEGQVLVLSKGDEQIPVWINKLTPFEMEEARQDGRVARARMILALRDIGSPEYVLFQSGFDEQSDESIVQALLLAMETEWYAAAIRDIRQDPDWKERAELMEAGAGKGLEDRPEDDPEVKVMIKVANEYGDHLQELVTAMRDEQKRELRSADRELLLEKYRESYLDQRGYESFTVAYQAAEVFFALRECKATQAASGAWEHDTCGSHPDRVLDSKLHAAALPTVAWGLIRQAIADLNMPQDVARFSAAPASSSASSEQPSGPAEDSAPSTPEVTDVELPGTS